MEFLICDKNKMELGGIPDNVAIDFDIGDTNDVEITCERGFLDFGMYLICPGTEYGALIEELDSWTSDSKETWMGNSFRRFLKEIVLVQFFVLAYFLFPWFKCYYYHIVLLNKE